MKKKTLYTKIISILLVLVIIYQPLSVFVKAQGTGTGYLDLVNSNTIYGWAYDSSGPNNQLNVQIYINGVYKTTVLANQYRPDVSAAGLGNGYNGYNYSMNWSGYAPGAYLVTAYAVGVDGNKYQLINTKSYIVVNAALTGYLDAVNSNSITGWAFDPNSPNNPLNVQIYINGQLKTTVAANQFRLDLLAAGLGNGYHVYNYSMDWSGYATGSYEVTAYAINTLGNKYQLYNVKTYSVAYTPTPTVHFPPFERHHKRMI